MSSVLSPASLWKRLRRTWEEWRAAPRWAVAYVLVSLVIFVSGHLKMVASFLRKADPCASSTVDDVSFPSLYSRLQHWADRPAHRDVVMVYIPENLADIQQNVCKARSYLADVLVNLQDQHPALVVIDKTFGDRSCLTGDDKKHSDDLIHAVSASPYQIVVGMSATNVADKQKRARACLCTTSGLSFNNVSNVSRGLLRPNVDLAKIPLRWQAFELGKSPPVGVDTIALKAFQIYAPEMFRSAEFQDILTRNRAPYADLDSWDRSAHVVHATDRDSVSTVDLICSRKLTRDRWPDDCPTVPAYPADSGTTTPNVAPSLLGKVVVIGSRDNQDKVVVGNESFWGYELQAIYLNALLTGSYLLAAPLPAFYAPYALYFLLGFLLFPPDGLAKARSLKNWSVSTGFRLLAILLLTCSYIVLFVFFHCFPPLGALLFFLPVLANQVLLQVQQGSHHRIKKHARHAAHHRPESSPSEPSKQSQETA